MHGSDIRISRETMFEVINFLASDPRSVAPRPEGDPAWLNPQPLPPMPAGIAAAEPWKAATVARHVVRLAAVTRASARTDEEGLQAARNVLNAFVDDLCGTVPRPGFSLPRGWPRIDVKPNGLDVLVAAARFHAAARAMGDDALSGALASGADRLLAAGLERLTSR